MSSAASPDVSSAGYGRESRSAAQTAAGRALCAAVFLFGLGLVFVTGFAEPRVLHNAAHDTRHALAFPCH